MTSVIIDREIGNWHRFNNRRQIASYTGLCPGEYIAGKKDCKAASPNTAIPDSERPWWNWPGDWSVSSPTTARCANGKGDCAKGSSPPAQRAKKPSSLWPANSLWICGVCAPADSHQSNWD